MTFDLLLHVETSRQIEEELVHYESLSEQVQLNPREDILKFLADDSLQKVEFLWQKISEKLLAFNSTVK